MKLRLLERDDAIPMHDLSVANVLPMRFEDMTLEDGYAFIEVAKHNQEKDLRLAICDSNEDYLGTVSLKNINQKTVIQNMQLQYPEELGKGIAHFAT